MTTNFFPRGVFFWDEPSTSEKFQRGTTPHIYRVQSVYAQNSLVGLCYYSLLDYSLSQNVIHTFTFATLLPGLLHLKPTLIYVPLGKQHRKPSEESILRVSLTWSNFTFSSRILSPPLFPLFEEREVFLFPKQAPLRQVGNLYEP